ncbi:MAG: GC-type dockerin domain-anchored protein [Phycisphaerales bacterium JB060]
MHTAPSHRRACGLLVAAALTAASPALAIDDVEPGPTRALERDTVFQPSYGDQFYGEVAAGVDEYFAVWADTRVGGRAPIGFDLYGQRINPDGTLEAPGSIALLASLDRRVDGVPAVAFNGSIYLAAWCEGDELWAMRIEQDGTPIDPDGFLVGVRRTLQWPSIASDGDGFLIAQGGRDDNLYATRVGADGAVLDPDGLIIDSGVTSSGFPKVAFGDGAYVVTWSRLPGGNVRALRITPDGTLVDGVGGFDVSGGDFDVSPQIAYDGEKFLIGWSREDVTHFDLYSSTVDFGAGIAVSTPQEFLDGATLGFIRNTQIAFNGRDHLFLITVDEPTSVFRDVYAMRLDTGGFALDLPFPVDNTPQLGQTSFGLASLDGQWLAGYEASDILGVDLVYDVQAARIDAGGTVLDRPQPLEISPGATWQVQPAIAATAGTAPGSPAFLTVFEDWREGPSDYQPDLYGVRVDSNGVPIDTTAFPVSTIAGSAQTDAHATYADSSVGEQFAVAFQSQNGAIDEIRLARLTLDGALLTPAGGTLLFANQPNGDALDPRIAFNGDRFAVAFSDGLLAPGESALRVRMADASGAPIGDTLNVPAADRVNTNAFDVAAGPDGEFLISWTRPSPGGAYATRLSSDGAFLGTATLQTTGTTTIRFSRVAYNPRANGGAGSYLVAWTQFDGGGLRVFTRPVGNDGRPLGPTVALTDPTSNIAVVSVMASGEGFVLGGSSLVGSGPSATFQRWVLPVDDTGATTAERTVLARSERDLTYGDAAFALTGGSLLAGYSQFESNPKNAARLFVQPAAIGGCPADIDGDGVLTIFDFLAFQNAFDAGEPIADFDGDGVLTLFDFLAFQNQFDAGCA